MYVLYISNQIRHKGEHKGRAKGEEREEAVGHLLLFILKRLEGFSFSVHDQ